VETKHPLVLVDTSVWIDFLKKGRTPDGGRLETLIKTDSACLTPLIRAEILSGARNEKDYQTLSSTLSAVKMLTEPKDLWDRIARIRYTLARRGFQVSVPDLSIALYAEFHRCPVFTTDKAFKTIAKVVSIKMI
jgi:predicted nucleic acid-binding protein